MSILSKCVQIAAVTAVVALSGYFAYYSVYKHKRLNEPLRENYGGIMDPIEEIENVMKEVRELKKEIDGVEAISRNDYKYRYLDDMLTRCLLKLDSVESFGREDIRKARREAINYVEYCVTLLETLPESTQNIQEQKRQSSRKNFSN